MNPKQSDRRRFLKGGAALAGLAAGAIAIPSANGQSLQGRAYPGSRRHVRGNTRPRPRTAIRSHLRRALPL